MNKVESFIKDLEDMGVLDQLRCALHATSWAQSSGNVDFDRIEKLQEAYVILWEVYVEAMEYYSDEPSIMKISKEKSIEISNRGRKAILKKFSDDK